MEKTGYHRNYNIQQISNLKQISPFINQNPHMYAREVNSEKDSDDIIFVNKMKDISYLPEIQAKMGKKTEDCYTIDYLRTEPDERTHKKKMLKTSKIGEEFRLSSAAQNHKLSFGNYPQTPMNRPNYILNNYSNLHASTEVLNTEVTLNDSFYDKVYKNFKKENLKNKKKGKKFAPLSKVSLDNALNVSQFPKTTKSEIPRPSFVVPLQGKTPKKISQKKIKFEEEVLSPIENKVKAKVSRNRGVSGNFVLTEYKELPIEKVISSPKKSPLVNNINPVTYNLASVSSKPIAKNDKPIDTFKNEENEPNLMPTTTNLISNSTTKKQNKGFFCCLPFLCK